MQSDLFPVCGTPEWFPEETCFSLCSRYHTLSGNLLASSTCQQIFGHGQRGTAHDFPSRLDEFVRRTRGFLGTAEEIIRSKTLLSYYLPFRSIESEKNAFAAMCGNGIGSLKFQLGILTSRFGASHPLKACLQCMHEDEIAYGSAYWHLQHQYPGSWICLRHASPLMVSKEKSNGVGRFLWLLPRHEVLMRAHQGHIPDSGLNFLIGLAQNTSQLTQLPNGFHFDAQLVVQTYHIALRELGLATARGTLNNSAIGSAYLEFAGQLRQIPDVALIPTSKIQAADQVLRLLRNPRSGTHPIRHLLLIRWLFSDWCGFWNMYRRNMVFEEEKITIMSEHCDQKVSDDISDAHLKIIYAVQQDGFSVRRAAVIAGVDVSTAIAWLASAGISTKRRPKKLKGTIWRHLLVDLRSGMNKKLAAKKYEISESTVMKTLRQEVGLYDAWLSFRRESTRKAARADWLKLQARYPCLGMQQLRKMNARVYAWLYRNDRPWLAECSRHISKPPRKIQSCVDWHVRDVTLSEQVRNAVLRLRKGSSQQRFMLQNLYQVLPDLRSKILRLERLPLTRHEIDIFTSKNVF